MKKAKLLYSVLFIIFTVGCSPVSVPTTELPTSINSSTTASTTTEPTSEILVTTETPTTVTTTTKPITTEDPTTQTPTTNPTTDTPTEAPTTNVPTTNPTTETPIEEEIPSSGETLPIGNGNKTVSGPKNSKNPINIEEWVNFDFYNSIPEYWSYIQGNNKVNSRGDFYAESAGGGFKFSQLYYGLQTPVLTSWVKTEVRLSISKVANNSQKKDEGEPIFHIYGYDITGHVVETQYIEQGTITAQSEGKEIKFYIRNEDVAYFELRLNAFPYKGSQCYNFGVDEISIKGWEYE